MIELLTLFFEFFKTGLFSIGGGLATLPFLYDLADKYDWFDRGLLANMIAVSESTPGPIGVNISTYAGFSAYGVLGGIVTTLALITPSVIIIILVAKFLDKFKDSKYVQDMFYGLRPAVTALIAGAGIEVLKISIFSFGKFQTINNIIDIINIKSTILFAILFYVSNKYKTHPLFIILISGLVGIIFKLN